MRDRLIELIQNSVNGCARHWAEIIADYLLENGVIVLDKNNSVEDIIELLKAQIVVLQGWVK